MERIDLTHQDWKYVKTVFDFFSKETDCFDDKGKLVVCPKYVVAIGGDAASAYYAGIIMKKALLQFGRYPTLLCCGWKDMFTSYKYPSSNGILNDGEMLRYVSNMLYSSTDTHVEIFDKGLTCKETLKDMFDLLSHERCTSVIFCPTQRFSKVLERHVMLLHKVNPSIIPYWYVYGETLEDIIQNYNGNNLAHGLFLLSEAAQIYSAISLHYSLTTSSSLYEGNIPKRVIIAGDYLVRHYPLLVTQSKFSAPKQFLKMYFALKKNKTTIAADLEEKIKFWMYNL